MSDAITTLEEQLALTDEEGERLHPLLDLCQQVQRNEPRRALRLAKDALRLAASRRQRKEQARSYLLIGGCHHLLADGERAELYLRRAQRMSEREGDREGVGNALNVLAMVCTGRGDYRQAIEYFNEALLCFRSIGSPRVRVVLNNLAPVYSQLGDYAMGLECLYQSLAMYEETGESTASVLLHIGYIHSALKEWNRAEEYMEQSLRISRTSGDLRGEGAALKNLATIRMELKDYDGARRYAQQALAVAAQIEDSSLRILSIQAIASCHFMQGAIDESLRWHREALELAGRLNQRDAVCIQQFNIAIVLHAQGKLHEAIPLAREAIAAAEAIGYREVERNIHRVLYEIFEQIGDAASALQHFKQATAINEELLGTEMQNAISRIQMRAEMEKAERDREILRLKAEQLELEMQHKVKELTALAMQLVQKNELLDELKRQIGELAASKNGASQSSEELAPILRQIEASRTSEQEWETFEQQFRSLHPGFIDTMARQCPELSPTELKICALMKINLATKEIANILCCSTRTVEDHRYRVRSKLGLPKGTNLASYLASVKSREP